MKEHQNNCIHCYYIPKEIYEHSVQYFQEKNPVGLDLGPKEKNPVGPKMWFKPKGSKNKV